jgi:hypothetical protein
MSQILIENAIKATQSADLLLQDLQSMNKTGDMKVSLLVLPEIEKVVNIKSRLEAILAAVST